MLSSAGTDAKLWLLQDLLLRRQTQLTPESPGASSWACRHAVPAFSSAVATTTGAEGLCNRCLQSPNNLVVADNLFDGNSAGNAGGGVAVVGAGEAGGNNATVTGNVFLGNQVGCAQSNVLHNTWRAGRNVQGRMDRQFVCWYPSGDLAACCRRLLCSNQENRHPQPALWLLAARRLVRLARAAASSSTS